MPRGLSGATYGGAPVASAVGQVTVQPTRYCIKWPKVRDRVKADFFCVFDTSSNDVRLSMSCARLLSCSGALSATSGLS